MISFITTYRDRSKQHLLFTYNTISQPLACHMQIEIYFGLDPVASPPPLILSLSLMFVLVNEVRLTNNRPGWSQIRTERLAVIILDKKYGGLLTHSGDVRPSRYLIPLPPLTVGVSGLGQAIHMGSKSQWLTSWALLIRKYLSEKSTASLPEFSFVQPSIGLPGINIKTTPLTAAPYH